MPQYRAALSQYLLRTDVEMLSMLSRRALVAPRMAPCVPAVTMPQVACVAPVAAPPCAAMRLGFHSLVRPSAAMAKLQDKPIEYEFKRFSGYDNPVL